MPSVTLSIHVYPNPFHILSSIFPDSQLQRMKSWLSLQNADWRTAAHINIEEKALLVVVWFAANLVVGLATATDNYTINDCQSRVKLGKNWEGFVRAEQPEPDRRPRPLRKSPRILPSLSKLWTELQHTTVWLLPLHLLLVVSWVRLTTSTGEARTTAMVAAETKRVVNCILKSGVVGFWRLGVDWRDESGESVRLDCLIVAGWGWREETKRWKLHSLYSYPEVWKCERRKWWGWWLQEVDWERFHPFGNPFWEVGYLMSSTGWSPWKAKRTQWYELQGCWRTKTVKWW